MDNYKSKGDDSKRSLIMRSLVRSTSKVEGHARTLKWGLERLTSKSITYTNLHKSNNKLINA